MIEARPPTPHQQLQRLVAMAVMPHAGDIDLAQGPAARPQAQPEVVFLQAVQVAVGQVLHVLDRRPAIQAAPPIIATSPATGPLSSRNCRSRNSMPSESSISKPPTPARSGSSANCARAAG